MLGQELGRIAKLYMLEDGKRYTAPAPVQLAKEVLALIKPGQRLWRDEVADVLARAVIESTAGEATNWLVILAQYHSQVECHTRGSYPPHCAQCDQVFTPSSLPECIVITRPLAELYDPGFRIGALCRACMSYSDGDFPELSQATL
jgi:hypothetical protein